MHRMVLALALVLASAGCGSVQGGRDGAAGAGGSGGSGGTGGSAGTDGSMPDAPVDAPSGGCSSDPPCGMGKYCDLPTGTCLVCNPMDPVHCGTASSPPGCARCTGMTPGCGNGRCICTGTGMTNDSCAMGTSLVCREDGTCGPCTRSTPQCAVMGNCCCTASGMMSGSCEPQGPTYCQMLGGFCL